MKRYFSGITAQQAPMPCAARQALVSLPGAVHTALRMPHRTRFRSAFASTAPRTSVVIVEPIEENKLARIQRVTGLAFQPVRTRSVGRGLLGTSVSVVIAQRSVSAMRALYQFMNRLMLREIVRNTSMISAIASIAWPVWFSVVFATETMS